MNSDLVDRWNRVVAEDDEVVVLGDFALGRITDTLPLARSLRGRKTLVPGNHDLCWDGPYESRGGTAAQWVAEYSSAGFTVAPGPVRAQFGKVVVQGHHFPYFGDSQDEDRFLDHRPADDGGWLLHGHVHAKWKQNGRMINVGVDAWGGYPVADEQLIELIAAGPASRPRIAWPALQVTN